MEEEWNKVSGRKNIMMERFMLRKEKRLAGIQCVCVCFVSVGGWEGGREKVKRVTDLIDGW